MPHREDHDRISLRPKSIEGDEPGPAVRDDQLAHSLVDAPPDQRMISQDLHALINSTQRLPPQRDVGPRVMAKDPLERR